MKGKTTNFQILFNIFVIIIICIGIYLYFKNKKESFEGIAGTSFVSRVPKGTIVAFNGTVAPAGWAICNGDNGTPDIRGKFIWGYNPAGGAKPNNRWNNIMGDSGGEEQHTLSVDEMPNHSHNVPGALADGSGFTAFSKGGWDIKQGAGSDSRGGNKPHNNLPPFIVLVYIMKL